MLLLEVISASSANVNNAISKSKSIKVLVAESHELTRKGLCALINDQPTLQLLDNTHCFNHLIRLAHKYYPDVILIDIALKNGQWIQQITELHQSNPDTKILALTSGHDEETLFELFHLGIAGVFNKNLGCELLLKAIQSVHAGELWFDRQLIRLLRLSHSQANAKESIAPAPAHPHHPVNTKFTPRERSVVCLAIKGMSAKKMAQHLGLSEKTVRNQLTVIYEKLQVTNQIELCLKSTQLGLEQLMQDVQNRDKYPGDESNKTNQQG
jgi:DNA-binding NarL/FixJ family response regulator